MAEETDGFGPSEIDGGGSNRVEHYFSVGSTGEGAGSTRFRAWSYWKILWFALWFALLAAGICGGFYWLLWRAAVREG